MQELLRQRLLMQPMRKLLLIEMQIDFLSNTLHINNLSDDMSVANEIAELGRGYIVCVLDLIMQSLCQFGFFVMKLPRLFHLGVMLTLRNLYLFFV